MCSNLFKYFTLYVVRCRTVKCLIRSLRNVRRARYYALGINRLACYWWHNAHTNLLKFNVVRCRSRESKSPEYVIKYREPRSDSNSSFYKQRENENYWKSTFSWRKKRAHKLCMLKFDFLNLQGSSFLNDVALQSLKLLAFLAPVYYRLVSYNRIRVFEEH